MIAVYGRGRRVFMFYYVSKIFWFFAVPSNFFTIAILAGAALWLAGRARTGRFLVFGGAAALLLFGLTPISLFLLQPLETRFPPYKDDGTPVDGVIILGGSFETAPTVHHGQMALNDSGERILAIATVARRFPNARIVYTGGGSGFDFATTSEATLLERTAQAMGVEPGRIVYERESLDTYENAIKSKAIVKPKPGERWLVVTSAFHIPRSVGVFRKAGWPVIAHPVDFRSAGPNDSGRFFPAVSQGMARTDIAIREYIGLAGYWATGRTDALFPAP